MVLVDTSIWVDHFRRGNAGLAALLDEGRVASHPCVVGELRLGGLRHRARVLEHLDALPRFPVADEHEVTALVERRKLMGTGIGWVDAHLLTSALLASGPLWSLDSALDRQARRLGVRRWK